MLGIGFVVAGTEIEKERERGESGGGEQRALPWYYSSFSYDARAFPRLFASAVHMCTCARARTRTHKCPGTYTQVHTRLLRASTHWRSYQCEIMHIDRAS